MPPASDFGGMSPSAGKPSPSVLFPDGRGKAVAGLFPSYFALMICDR